MDKVSELRDCPLCGAAQGARTGGPKLMVSDSKQGWTVRCTGCLARGPNVFTQAEAVKRWNSRPGLESLQQRVEKLDLASDHLGKLEWEVIGLDTRRAGKAGQARMFAHIEAIRTALSEDTK
jgi:hypothetical protein